MKRVSFIIIIAGLLMLSSGIYLIFAGSDEVVKDEFDFAVTEKEKNDILTYLNSKYNYEFTVESRVSRFCIVQKENEHPNYELDGDCDQKEIIDDIFKVKDKDGITFYVKKVSTSENINVLDSLKNSQSNGFYDSYLIYYLTDKLTDNLIVKFSFLDNISIAKIFYGLGIEDDTTLANNKNLNIYQDLGRDIQNVFNKNMTNDEFINKAIEYGFSFHVGLYIKVDMDINSKNVQSIVKSIKEENVYDLGYNIDGSDILIEFNDNRFIKIKNGVEVTINEYTNNVFESNPKRLYENEILLNNDIFAESGITYDNFINLKESYFEF